MEKNAGTLSSTCLTFVRRRKLVDVCAWTIEYKNVVIIVYDFDIGEIEMIKFNVH